jgi:hypothetical protein
MLVKDLIEQLKNLPENSWVVINNGYYATPVCRSTSGYYIDDECDSPEFTTEVDIAEDCGGVPAILLE